jgi:hypothetical protein
MCLVTVQPAGLRKLSLLERDTHGNPQPKLMTIQALSRSWEDLARQTASQLPNALSGALPARRYSNQIKKIDHVEKVINFNTHHI